MSPATGSAVQLIRAAVRGERPWTDLRALGIDLRPEAGEAHGIPPTDVKIDIHGLATGFVAHWHDPAALRAWTFTLQALDADFAPVEEHPSGETVLDALWNASFGEPLSQDQVALIKQLAAQRRSVS